MSIEDAVELVVMHYETGCSIAKSLEKVRDKSLLITEVNMKEFKVGDKVHYRSEFKNQLRTGSIICIVQILDHSDPDVIGRKVCYVSKGPGYTSDKVFIEDLQPVENDEE